MSWVPTPLFAGVPFANRNPRGRRDLIDPAPSARAEIRAPGGSGGRDPEIARLRGLGRRPTP